MSAPIEFRPVDPLSFDADLCISCNLCVEVCQVDIMLPSPGVGEPPLVAYPEECWYDGSCVDACPVPGAISLNSLARNRVQSEGRRAARISSSRSLPWFPTERA
jgi:NAD-dependent dihydropyrimidine dehydrogenase PreA subunit